MTVATLKVGANDILVELESLTNQADDSVISDATVQATIYDAGTGVELPGVTWPLTLQPIGNGNYRNTIEAAAVSGMVPGRAYRAVYTAVAPVGIDFERIFVFQAVEPYF